MNECLFSSWALSFIKRNSGLLLVIYRTCVSPRRIGNTSGKHIFENRKLDIDIFDTSNELFNKTKIQN